MNEFKGTPAPWLYRGKSDSVHVSCETHPFGKQIFQFNSGFNEEGLPSDADLALILAAPLLYAALARLTQAAQDANIGYLDAAVAEGWDALELVTSNSN